MSKTILGVLVVIFISFLCAGLIVYTVFFAIHKKYFRRQLTLVKKFNELINGLNSVNIFKIQVLADNDLGEKLDLKKYIEIYNELKDNSVILRANIYTSEAELNSFNLKIARNYIFSIEKKLDEALKNLNELQTTYINYTQYGHAIGITFQNYLEIYEYLLSFYETKLEYHCDFNKINALFNSIKKTLENVPKLSIKFDYKRTIDTILDLGKKLRTLANIILFVYRFQMIDTYLKTSKEINDKLLNQHYSEIWPTDLQILQNLLTIFSQAYGNFNRQYRSLDLKKAAQFSIQALNSINQINQFIYIHINTPTLINLSISEIKDQTDKILLNKESIVNGVRNLRKYFVLEPEILKNFESIEKGVNDISKLSERASLVTYRTHTEKIRAVEELDYVAKQIIDCKFEIVQSINKIDDMLGKVIKTVTDLNDLYICYWQLLSIAKQLAPNNNEVQGIKSLLRNNISQIESYLKQIVSSEKPNFDMIAHELNGIIEQSQQIYKRLSTTLVLKQYASKLLMYINRYKAVKQLKKDFEEVNEMFVNKQYNECIDKLILIHHKSRKYNNKSKS